MSNRYEWWTDPSGGRHFGRVFPKAKAKKGDVTVEAPAPPVLEKVVVDAPVAVVRDDTEVAKAGVTVKAKPRAKKKSSG